MRSVERAAPLALLAVVSPSECSPLCLRADELGVQISRNPRIGLGYSESVLDCAHHKDPEK